MKTSGRQSRGHGRADERGAVEILRDLGLSTEKIVAYHRRFPTPTPTPTSCGCRPPASIMRR